MTASCAAMPTLYIWLLCCTGVIIHPTSLPGPYGIGEIGSEALALIDWIASAGLSLWQARGAPALISLSSCLLLLIPGDRCLLLSSPVVFCGCLLPENGCPMSRMCTHGSLMGLSSTPFCDDELMSRL
jgi:hypothetical protein